MIEARKVTKYYKNRDTGEKTAILHDCDFLLSAGDIAGLMGKSGSGKSTLARVLLGLIKIDEGDIYWEGKPFKSFGKDDWQKFRRQVQFISQAPDSFFDSRWKLQRSLEEVFRIHAIIMGKNTENEIAQALEQVELDVSLLNRYPHQLSGGELQRFSIARAMLLKPQVLILDEPTSMLDISVQAHIFHLLKRLYNEHRMTMLIISHDRLIVDWFCNRKWRIDSGRTVVEEPKEVSLEKRG